MLCFLLINILFEGIGVPDWTANILSGASKLLAMAMFLSAAYAALLEQLHTTVGLLQQERLRQAKVAMTPRSISREQFLPRPEAEPEPEAEPAPESTTSDD